MAKQGQHNHDRRDQDVSPGPNNPGKSDTIVTGTYKRQETYKKQAAEHKDPGKRAQAAKHEWHDDTRANVTHEADSEQRALDAQQRSGSDSNANTGTRGH